VRFPTKALFHKRRVMSKEKIDHYVNKWLKPLGLLWWTVGIIYLDDPKELIEKDFYRDEDYVLGRTYADWKYGRATVYFNVPAFEGLSDEDVEMAVVHEFIHILVNEAREGEIHHEERVVTNLTKAFIWVRGDMMDANIDQLLNQSYPPGSGVGQPVGLPSEPPMEPGMEPGGTVTMEVTQEEAAVIEQMRALKGGV
jgi:hypothetical protein